MKKFNRMILIWDERNEEQEDKNDEERKQKENTLPPHAELYNDCDR